MQSTLPNAHTVSKFNFFTDHWLSLPRESRLFTRGRLIWKIVNHDLDKDYKQTWISGSKLFNLVTTKPRKFLSLQITWIKSETHLELKIFKPNWLVLTHSDHLKDDPKNTVILTRVTTRFLLVLNFRLDSKVYLIINIHWTYRPPTYLSSSVLNE